MPTLIVEDGTGKVDSNTYISEAFADTFHSDRANDEWADLEATEKQSALIKATDYIDNTYRLRWKGFRVSETQALTYPRADVYDEDHRNIADNDIPARVENALAEIALAIAPTSTNSGVFLDPYAVDRDNAPIKSLTEKVDVIQVSTEYMDASQAGTSALNNQTKVRFENGKAWLAGLLKSSISGRVDRG